MENSVKPGWRTSEFWLHILAQVPTVLAIFLGASNPFTLGVGAIGGIVSSLYAVNRADLKGKAFDIALAAAEAAAAKAAGK